ncbi:GntR family transcriptional regulator [Actinomadura scrupuli]|uniref:GntR family transcriptional regulator n=1 Tax=Actinomadura scrupuli TaxID=559629 RepID=UPI003D95A4BF
MAGQPKWREVAEDLRQRIEAGEFDTEKGRSRLPQELTLQGQYQTSRNTVREAIRWLTDQSLVETEAGKGTFVLFRPAPFHVTLSARGGGPGGGEGTDYTWDAKVQGLAATDSAPRVEIQQADGRPARHLKLAENTQVVLRHQRRYLDGKAWSIQTSYYPLDFAARGASRLLEATDIAEGVVKYLEHTFQITQMGYHDEIKVRPPDHDEAAFFGLPENGSVPVYETFRTAYDQNGDPFRLTVTIWPADRNRLHYNVGIVPDSVTEAPGDEAGR